MGKLLQKRLGHIQELGGAGSVALEKAWLELHAYVHKEALRLLGLYGGVGELLEDHL
jgi:hypothetical protein